MATVRITHRYADGDVTTFEIEVDQMFSGAVTEAVGEVLRMWSEAVPEAD